MPIPDGAVLLLAFLLAGPAPDPTGPWARWHFVFPSDLELSILFRRDGTGDETRLLVKHRAGRFELVSRQGPSGEDSTESVRSLEEDETLSRRLLFTPDATESACERLGPKDACVVLTGKNGTLAAPISGFAGERGAATRERAAALVSTGMKKRLHHLAPVLPYVAEFGAYTDDFLGLVWLETFRGPSALKHGKRARGCDFDASFAHPCAPQDREREEKRFSGEKP